MTYLAAWGFDPSAVAATSGRVSTTPRRRRCLHRWTISASPLRWWIPGYLDGAKFWRYIVDYTTGRIIALVHFGFLGEVRYRDKLLAIPDLVSLSQMAAEGLCRAGSKTTRRPIGDASTGVPARVFVDGRCGGDGLCGMSARIAYSRRRPRCRTRYHQVGDGRSMQAASVVGVVRRGCRWAEASDALRDRHRRHLRLPLTAATKKWATCKTLLALTRRNPSMASPFAKEAIGDTTDPGATTR